jgi:hypothetical protein
MAGTEHGPDCVDPQPVYFCPTSMEFESPCHGGFDTCCDIPALHIPQLSLDELYASLARQMKANLSLADSEGDAVGLIERALELLEEPGQLGMAWWNERRSSFLTDASNYMNEAT